jgi:hypothetical protein
MADIEVKSKYLLDLREQLGEIGIACQALNNYFVIGSRRLAQEPDVKRLQNLVTSITQRLEESALKEASDRASLADQDSTANAGTSVYKIVGVLLGKGAWIGNAEVVEKKRAGKPHCFGTIMIVVGQDGLPDDVDVLLVSKLARINKKEEFEIIQEIQHRGYWLYLPEVFLKILDTFLDQLRRGELRLPILPKQLPAKLAIPRQITVDFLLPFKAVPQLAPGRNMNTGGESNPPNVTN